MQTVLGRDAAFANNIGQDFSGVICGYLGGPNAFHAWSAGDWRQFPKNPKLPIWVGGGAGISEAAQALTMLHIIGAQPAKVMMLDMETRVDTAYVEAFGGFMQWAGYRVWVYGSKDTVFSNPQLNGYAVADPTGEAHMFNHPGVRLTQYSFGDKFDADNIRQWVVAQDDFWV